MKKQYLFLVLTTCLMGAAMAQTTDSIQTGGSYANDVYYSFETGTVKEVANSDWQLAFSIGNFNVGVRANTVSGSTKDGQVAMYEMPDTDTTQWTAFDTTNYQTTWALLNNSDETWEDGALNQNATGQFDYGWGAYNSSTHAIVGHRLYLAVITSGVSTIYKKVFVLNKTMGTWNVRFANLDGSEQKELAMSSTAYSTKNFVYLSLVSGNIVDREPANTAWDFIYTRYAAWQPAPQSVYYPATGMFTNAGVTVSEVRDLPDSSVTLADTTGFSMNMSTIGSDWKQGIPLVTVDSLSYFVKLSNGDIWKLVFNRFESGSSPSGTGKAVFTKTKVYTLPPTGLNTVSNISTFTVYPNPTSDVVNLIMDVTETNSTIAVSDLSGKVLFTQNIQGSGFINTPVDMSAYSNGIYFISVTNGNSSSVQKVVVN